MAGLTDLAVKPDFGGFGGFGAKAGKRWFWPIRWQSRETVIRWLQPVFADLELKGGIDLFAGKSEITEGCSDFREIGDSDDLPGISDLRLSKSYGSDAAGAARTAVRRKVGRRGKADAAGASWSVRVPFLSAFSRQLRGCWGSTDDSKADGGDGRGDLRGESFGGPMFSGAGGEKLARERSWRRALSGRIWR